MAGIDHHHHFHAACELREVGCQFPVLVIVVVCADARIDRVVAVIIRIAVAVGRMREEERVTALRNASDVRDRLADRNLRRKRIRQHGDVGLFPLAALNDCRAYVLGVFDATVKPVLAGNVRRIVFVHANANGVMRPFRFSRRLKGSPRPCDNRRRKDGPIDMFVHVVFLSIASIAVIETPPFD